MVDRPLGGKTFKFRRDKREFPRFGDLTMKTVTSLEKMSEV